MNVAKTSCRTCGKRLTPPPKQCTCVSKPGSDGGGSGGGTDAVNTGKASASGTTMVGTNRAGANEVAARSSQSNDFSLYFKSDERHFDREVILKLLTDKLISINNDMSLGILMIKQLNQLTPDQRAELSKYMNALVHELIQFKNERSGLTGELDDKGKVRLLQISLPSIDLYKAFIKRLADKELLPINMTPLSTVLTRHIAAGKKALEAENVRNSYLRPNDIKKGPIKP